MKTKNRILVLGATSLVAVGIFMMTSPNPASPQAPALPHLISVAQAAPQQSSMGYTGSDPAPSASVTTDSLIHGAIVREIIQEKLADVMSGVRINVRNGAVTLSGTVPTQFFRQRVGAIAATVVSSANVDNEVIVTG